jgi:hypothetical protein
MQTFKKNSEFWVAGLGERRPWVADTSQQRRSPSTATPNGAVLSPDSAHLTVRRSELFTEQKSAQTGRNSLRPRQARDRCGNGCAEGPTSSTTLASSADVVAAVLGGPAFASNRLGAQRAHTAAADLSADLEPRDIVTQPLLGALHV